jgi:hypothetical protein
MADSFDLSRLPGILTEFSSVYLRIHFFVRKKEAYHHHEVHWYVMLCCAYLVTSFDAPTVLLSWFIAFSERDEK